jgi:predicted CxxxxCH...CXXCH cytochrome family protein
MRAAGWMWVLVVACGSPTTSDKGPGTIGDDDDDTGPTTTTTTEDGFCAVRRAFVQECVVCHSSEAPQGDLDLETDAYAAVVNVTSAAYGEVLVVPGDPEGSLLYRKVSGTQSGTEGDPMPPNGDLPAVATTVRQWITDGATELCGTPGTTTTTPPYHPAGWDAPEVHGLATKLQTEADCRTCHGQDLDGGSSAVACDDCHAADWETNCTFCHGGVQSTSGAPPEDIDDNADPATISFVPHEVHLAARIMPAYTCDQCHTTPTDALTPGHLFDDPTAGEAEVVIQGGSYAPGTCSDLYCHGNGRGFNGVVDSDAGARDCSSCHGGAQNAGTLSGRHGDHVREGILCSECHADAQGNNGIDQPELHVNGVKDLDLPANMVFDPTSRRCDGTCHLERHNSRAW